MNFKEWQERYYPDELQCTIDRMNQAWAAGTMNIGLNREPIDSVKMSESDLYCGEDELWASWYECPICKESNIVRSWAFCPNCGVKLEWVEDAKAE